MIWRALLFGLLSSIGGAVAGFIAFVLLLKFSWFNGPDGLRIMYAMVLFSAIGFGVYGFAGRIRKLKQAGMGKNYPEK